MKFIIDNEITQEKVRSAIRITDNLALPQEEQIPGRTMAKKRRG